MIPCKRAAKPCGVLFEHLIKLVLNKGAQVGDFNIFVRSVAKIGLQFFKIDLAQIPGLAGLRDAEGGFIPQLAGIVHDQTFIQQLADAQSNGINVSLLNDGIEHAAQILKHCDRTVQWGCREFPVCRLRKAK